MSEQPKNFISFQDSDEDYAATMQQRMGVNRWPPPEEVWVVRLPDNDTVLVVVETDEQLAEVARFWADTGVEMNFTPYGRTRMSRLTDADASHPHIARGAVYVPVVRTKSDQEVR